MNTMELEHLKRALDDGEGTRRAFARRLTGLIAGAALLPFGLGLDEAEAKKKRKKGKKRKRRGQGDGGNDTPPGGNPPGGDNPPPPPPPAPPPAPPPPPPGCDGTICDGQCVDLATDPNNCGACGDICAEGAACANRLCVLAFGSEGDGDGQFDSPRGIALRGNGAGFVTDSGNDRLVQLFGGTFRDVGFELPVGVAVNDDSGEVYIVDVGTHRIQRIAANGEFLQVFGSLGSGVEQFERPFGIAIDQQTDQVFVADTGNNRIQRLTATFFPVGRFGTAGSGPGQFNAPEGIAIDGNRNVVVADTGNNRIQILNQDGEQIREFGRLGSGPSDFNRPVAVAVTEGTIFVADAGNNRIQQFTNSGQLLRVIGRGGSGIGEFNAPSGIAITDNDVIHVVDSGNHRIQSILPPGLIIGQRVPGAKSSRSARKAGSRRRTRKQADKDSRR